MHINAFVPTGSAVMNGSAVDASQVPMTSFRLPPLKDAQIHQLSAPVLLCLWAENGEDHDPHFYVQARDAAGETRGNAEMVFIWDDTEGAPCKWKVFDLQLPFLIFTEGVYTFGVFANEDDPIESALASYRFPIIFDESLPALPSR